MCVQSYSAFNPSISFPNLRDWSLVITLHNISQETWVKLRLDLVEVLTSINAARQHVPLANRPIELWGRPVNQSTGLSGLSLGSSTVAELGANHQETLGRWLWRNQPARRFILWNYIILHWFYLLNYRICNLFKKVHRFVFLVPNFLIISHEVMLFGTNYKKNKYSYFSLFSCV